jgi:mono/diheme cytochrome c family protein
MAYYGAGQFPARYRGGMFVAFHGSWNRAPLPQRGYNVCFVPCDAQGRPTGKYEIFADGFTGRINFTSPSEARYRPCGVAVGPDGSLYVGETHAGRIWRIFYTGETTPAPASAASAPEGESAAPAAAPVAGQGNGRRLYEQLCLSCHMADGTGVPDMQPSLRDSAVVRGDPAVLARTVLRGPAAVLPSDRPKYSNIMPPFDAALDDAQAADLITYVRQAFGAGASPMTAAQVAALRNEGGSAK